MQGYDRCPRSLAERAEAYMRSTGIADDAFFGPENEFFVFDDVRWDDTMQGAFYSIDSSEGAWNTGSQLRGRQHGPPADRQRRLLPGTAGRLAA